MWKRLLLFASLGLLIAPVAVSHGGKLDSLGCHHDRQRGGYHCHRGVLAGRNFASKAEALKALNEKQGPTPPAKQEPKAPPPAPKAEPRSETDPEIRTVYVTRTGMKYHGPNCSYLRQSKIPVTLKDAQTKGYTPCSRCGGK
jgi:hypothetical protein